MFFQHTETKPQGIKVSVVSFNLIRQKKKKSNKIKQTYLLGKT